MTYSTLKSLFLVITLLVSFAASAIGGRSESDSPVLAHDVFGAGTEKVLVLHSWMGDATSFDQVKPYLDTDNYTYVFADLRGYGRSRDIKGEYNFSGT